MEEVYIYGELVMLFFLLYPSTPREGFLFYFFIFQIWVGGGDFITGEAFFLLR
jgi:hypothetical protein